MSIEATVYVPIVPGAAQRNMEMVNKGVAPDPIYYDEALLADNHSNALTTDQQGVGEVNYLASDHYLADADDDRTVHAMGQRHMTDAEYHRKVDQSQRLAFQSFELNYSSTRIPDACCRVTTSATKAFHYRRRWYWKELHD